MTEVGGKGRQGQGKPRVAASAPTQEGRETTKLFMLWLGPCQCLASEDQTCAGLISIANVQSGAAWCPKKVGNQTSCAAESGTTALGCLVLSSQHCPMN